MSAIYNEIDPFAARWLRNLIAAGHIAPGVVDERSVSDLVPADVAGLGQRHFFAGIAGWSLALRLAGVPDDADVWTGSCPCQSLSDAGKRLGFADPRHLWPEWFRLIRECRPAVVFGEQVASGLGWSWLDLVFADMEGAGYACAAANLPACSVGAPHRRQRILFVAYADEVRQQRAGLARFGFAGPTHRCDCGHVADSHEWHSEGPQECGECSCTYFAFDRGMANTDGQPRRLLAARREPRRADAQASRSREAGELADAKGTGRQERRNPRGSHRAGSIDDSALRSVANATSERRNGVKGNTRTRREQSEFARGGTAGCVGDPEGAGRAARWTSQTIGDPREPCRSVSTDHWSPCEWISCSDGVSRPVEPGTHPLAHGVPGRVGLLRGYGNAIVPEKVAAFIVAALEAA